ncbi:cell division protein FtsZ [Sphingomonas parva]|uniref:Cell division protein FtsZ n=1 Tax=Sphingomonas parva TaxID=2555898 RepID=A0A4Y8ZQJ0_9SPHN|nr:cell division protein FtsZ [Sphingomonas parva]TFI57089.1 cell division protein FtsZ [Sphingomonas parva]
MMTDAVSNYGSELRPRICVVGVGGAGGNAVANMIEHGVTGVEFIVANTDAQALNASPVERGIQLGREITQGLGAGAAAEIGRAAAMESLDEIVAALDGAHMCFIAAGMGGGTGTGAAPVIAAAARARGILTVGVVTKPFGFEGRRRAAAAEEGLAALTPHVDTLIVIPNQNLFRVVSPSTTFRQAFRMADEVLEQGVRSISDLILMPGLINLDFADVRTIMLSMGKAMLGTGEASGERRATDAAERAINNPLLDGAIRGARGLIISVAGGEDMRLMEIDEAAMRIKDEIHPDANIIWGSAVDPALEGRIRVSILATGIDGETATAAADQLETPAAMPFAASQAAPVAAAAEIAVSRSTAVIEPAEPIAEAAEPVEEPFYEVQIAAPWEDGYAATDTLVLAASDAVTVEGPRIDPAAAFFREPRGSDEGLILVQPPAPAAPAFAAGEFGGGRPVHKAVAAPLRGPSLLQRLSMLARGDGGRGGHLPR